jgi:hypothetical protein
MKVVLSREPRRSGASGGGPNARPAGLRRLRSQRGDRCALATLAEGGLADHKPSRRALLGAAVAIPFVGCGGELRHSRESGNPAPSSAGEGRSGIPDQVRDDGAWSEALSGFREAEGALQAFLRRTAGAPDEEQDAVEAEMDERLDALGPALLRLLEAPAPDLEGLAVKIETIVAHEAWSTSGGEGCLADLARDARRLAGG